MKKLNTPAALLFGLLSFVNLMGNDWLSAGLNALLAVGMWLSDLAYAPAGSGTGTTSLTVALPAWRRYTSMGLVLLALTLFGYQIGRDVKAKANRTTSTQAQ